MSAADDSSDVNSVLDMMSSVDLKTYLILNIWMAHIWSEAVLLCKRCEKKQGIVAKVSDFQKTSIK